MQTLENSGVELFGEDLQEHTATISPDEAKSLNLSQQHEVMVDDNYIEYIAQQSELDKDQTE